MDVGEYLRFLVALLFVLALFGGLVMVARRVGLGYPSTLKRPSGERRLEIVETASIDGRRRLVLVRRDTVEHLLVLGQNTETVVETDITEHRRRIPLARGDKAENPAAGEHLPPLASASSNDG